MKCDVCGGEVDDQHAEEIEGETVCLDCAHHDDDHGGEDWIQFIDRFLAKAVPYTMSAEEWYDGMLKAAALCVAALEAHGRRHGGSDD